MNYTYKVGDLRKALRESAEQFRPILGKNVESDNKKNAKEGNDAIEKDIKKAHLGLTEPDKKEVPERNDYNGKMTDLNPVSEPTKEFKDKVKAQAKGYTSTLEEKNDIEKADQYDEDGKILKSFDKDRDERQGEKEDRAKAGLVARELPEKKFEKNNLDESKKIEKTLKFKRTTFLSEQQVLQRVPDEYKKDGARIRMIDSQNNEYLVECAYSKMGDFMETNIVEHKNKNIMNEEVNRMFQLMDYKPKSRPMMESKEICKTAFQDILDKMRDAEE